MTKTQFELAQQIGTLNAEQEREFIKNLEEVLTAEEIEALQVVVAYIKMMSDPRREQAMKTALAEELYNEFNK